MQFASPPPPPPPLTCSCQRCCASCTDKLMIRLALPSPSSSMATLKPPPPPQPEPWRYRPFGCPVTSSWHNQYKYSNQSFACNATVPVRELLGLGPPWYFEIPPGNTGIHSVDAASGGGGGGSDQDANYLAAWEQLFDPEGFQAVWGPTTAEQRHRCFNWSKATDECNWAGPSWYACPSSTSFLYTLERILLGSSSSRSSAR